MGRRRRAWLVNRTGRKPGRKGYYVRWTEPAAAGRIIKRSRCFANRDDAKMFARQMSLSIELAGTSILTPIRLSVALDQFLAALSARTDATREQYAISVHRLAKLMGDIEVYAVDGAAIDRFIAVAMAQSAEATAAKHIRNLRRFFRWCVARGYAKTDPTKLATSPPRPIISHHRPHVSEKQFGALLAALDSADRRLAVQLAATTGLDRQVIANLTAADVDLERRQIRVVRTKTHVGVAPFLHDALVPPIRKKIADSAPGQRLFSGLHRQGRDRDWWKLAVKAAGVESLRFRDLRSYAANWLREAIGDFGAQKVLGHSSPQVTSKHYHFLDPDSQARISGRPLPGSPADRRGSKKATA